MCDACKLFISDYARLGPTTCVKYEAWYLCKAIVPVYHDTVLVTLLVVALNHTIPNEPNFQLIFVPQLRCTSYIFRVIKR